MPRRYVPHTERHPEARRALPPMPPAAPRQGERLIAPVTARRSPYFALVTEAVVVVGSMATLFIVSGLL